MVTAYTIDVESYRDGVAHVRLVTSPGFYVRTFAHELGERVGCGAHLEGLRRLRSGEFTLADAVTLGDLERFGGAGDRVIPLGRLLPHLPAVVLTREGARRAGHGVLLAPRDAADGRLPADAGRARLLDESGALVGIAEPAPGGLLHPVIVRI